MPELPDVEVFRRYFRSCCLGRQVREIRIPGSDLLEGTSEEEVEKALKGSSFYSARRHGKLLFCGTGEGKWLVLHFGMTGFLKAYSEEGQEPSHTRLRLRFSDGGFLAFDCQRRLGRISLTPSIPEYVQGKGLGVDPWDPDFDLDAFLGLVSGRRGAIKSALMNQQLVAGIGNIYADEILFQAGIHPAVPAGRLGEESLRGIYSVLQQVLERAVERGAEPSRMPQDFLLPRRDDPEGKCPSCGRPLRKQKISGRPAVFCPSCQQ